MREIKFRAWNKLINSMDYDIQNTHDSLRDSFADYLNDKYCVVMQFTGLTDVNGKEIYEGDILKCNNYLAVVVWDDNIPGFCIIGKFKNFCGGTYFDKCKLIANCEVIGNIHEHKYLLDRED